MGALAHYLERGGIATTQISLVRQHTEKIKPPRALWCPFELGRPFGAPNEPKFQTRVLKNVLSLLERENGPILEDFPDIPPGPGDLASMTDSEDVEGWTCPVNFGPGKQAVNIEDDPLEAISQEIEQLRSWYDLAIEKNGKTTVGISEIPLKILTEYLVTFVSNPDIALPRADLPRFQNLKLAIDDHKAYYFEAGSAKPGNPSDTDLANWFYGNSVMGSLLVKINHTCANTDDPVLQKMSDRRIIPIQQRHLKGETLTVPDPLG